MDVGNYIDELAKSTAEQIFESGLMRYLNREKQINSIEIRGLDFTDAFYFIAKVEKYMSDISKREDIYGNNSRKIVAFNLQNIPASHSPNKERDENFEVYRADISAFFNEDGSPKLKCS